jgi:hypothetical protein
MFGNGPNVNVTAITAFYVAAVGSAVRKRALNALQELNQLNKAFVGIDGAFQAFP